MATVATFAATTQTKDGRPNIDHRKIINGILWILRTGTPWHGLPTQYGKGHMVSSRFYRWHTTGLRQVLTTLQAEGDLAGDLAGLNSLQA